MPKAAGRVAIQIDAGTAGFFIDMEKANVKVRDFGREAGTAGQRAALGMRAAGDAAHGSVSGVQAASGAIRTLEGNVTNNVRAVERFLVTSLKLGPIMQAAFPIVGGIAFLGMLDSIGSKASEAYAQLRDAPEKLRGAYAALNGTLRTTNDELDVSNARLANEIAKLEGKRQNTLALSLDEARVFADKLADSLDRDLEKLNKLLDENKSTLTQQFFGRISDKGLREELGGKTGFGGFHGEVRQETEAGRAAIDAAAAKGDQKGVEQAIAALTGTLQKKYADMLAQIDRQVKAATVAPYVYDSKKSQVGNDRARAAYDNSLPFLEELGAARSAVSEEARGIPEQVEGYSLTKTKGALTAAAENSKLERPLENKLKELDERIAETRLKLKAAGMGEAEKVIAQAEGDALRAIEEVNKALTRQSATNKGLSAGDQEKIRILTTTLASTEAEEKWRSKLAETSATIKDQVQSQEMLTAAIGKGYEAVKAANVETQLMAKVGAEHYNDSRWMSEPKNGVAALRTGLSDAEEAKHKTQVETTLDSLRDQIGLEERLAQVQGQGAAAVKLATLEYNLQLLQEKENSQDLIALEWQRFNAQRATEAATGVAKVDVEIAAVKRLIAAQTEGAEAARKANLESKYDAIRLASGSTSPTGDAELKERENDQLEHQQEIGAAVSQNVNVFKNQLKNLEAQKAILQDTTKYSQDDLDVRRALRDIDDERLRIAVQQQLAQRDAMSGVRAFFLEMQTQSKSSGQILYEGLNGAVDRASDNLAKVMSGQKAAWGAMFRDVGEGMLKDVTKSTLHKALGQVGTHIPGVGALIPGTLDGQSPQKAKWVRIVNGAESSIAGAAKSALGDTGLGKFFKGIGGLFGGGSLGSGIFSFGPPRESVNSSISYDGARAEGGAVSPGGSYLVGERGPELFRSSVAGQVSSNADTRQMMQGGSHVHIGNIDVRGTDPVEAEQRMMTAARAFHSDAVSKSVQVHYDRGRRVPASSR